MRDIRELISAIDDVVRSSDERRRSRDAAHSSAAGIAARLPWTHRTGRPGKGDWRDIFRAKVLRAAPVGTAFERVLGLRRAVYFFVGSCAYPEGLAVLLFSFAPSSLDTSTFNPYDTGAIKKVAVPREPGIDWSAASQICHVASTMGCARDLPAFLGPYLSAHFRDPLEYVRRPQGSAPDFEPYHGLTGGDRRGWTVEARLCEDVSVDPGEGLREIWLEDQGLRKALPAGLRRFARIRDDDRTLSESVARRIEQMATGASS